MEDVKIISAEEIKNMSVTKLNSVLQTVKQIEINEEKLSLIYWMIQFHEEISNFKEKFLCIVNHIKKHRPEFVKGFLGIACDYVKEEPVIILLEWGCDPNYKNKENNTNTALFNLFLPVIEEDFPKEILEIQQKKILGHLIQYGIHLDIYKKETDGLSFYDTITLFNKEHCIEWIEEFKKDFNPNQKRQWDAFRLQKIM